MPSPGTLALQKLQGTRATAIREEPGLDREPALGEGLSNSTVYERPGRTGAHPRLPGLTPQALIPGVWAQTPNSASLTSSQALLPLLWNHVRLH